MKSVSYHVKKKIQDFQDIVHGQEFVVVAVVVVAFMFRKIYNKTIVDY